MPLKPFLFSLICLALFTSCEEEKVAFKFRVNNDANNQVSQPISIDLNRLKGTNINPKNPLRLVHEVNSEEIAIDFQIDSVGGMLWFVHEGGDSLKRDELYYIENGVSSAKTNSYVSEHKENGNLQLGYRDRQVLSYRYEMTYPPEGVDSIFKKSGYIHPILTPKGDTLSRIQPPDHYHHYGMWGPWTHTQIDSQQVDFWNLGDRKGTVLFKEFTSTDSGYVFASFNAAQEHIDLLTQEKPQVAINENLGVTLWNLNTPDRYMFDYTTTFSSPLEEGILFEAYRYGGGIGMRFAERWKAENTTVLTSEGEDRLTADGTNARWCIVSGESADGNGKSGILFMSHIDNRMHPEPMRVWPIDANDGRGDMFFEFCPIRHEEWRIEPNQEYELKYRMVVFDGVLNPDQAEAYWQSFVRPYEIMPIQN